MNEQGMTLLEITVVGAIIGILAMIAVPAYQNYTTRARQGQAKVLLASAYTTEMTFATENMSFSSCLAEIGFQHDGTDRYYAIGFGDPALTEVTCGRTANLACHRKQFPVPGAPVACAGGNSAGGLVANRSNNASAAAATRATLGSLAGDISQNTFLIRAAGNINYATAYDHWTVDQQKQMLNTAPAL